MGLGRRLDRWKNVRRALVQLDGAVGRSDLVAGQRGHGLAQLTQLVVGAHLIWRHLLASATRMFLNSTAAMAYSCRNALQRFDDLLAGWRNHGLLFQTLNSLNEGAYVPGER